MRAGLTESGRIITRRRLVMRAGLAGLVLVTGCAATACIFDQSDYQGGGRLGRAATAEQEKPEGDEPPPSQESPPSSESETDPPSSTDGG